LDQPRISQTLAVNVAAEECLIDFHNALEFGEFLAASLTKTVEHEPCRLLLDANLFGDLHGRDAFGCSYKQVHGIEPLVERDMRPLEDRASADREIKLAFVAAMEASLARRNAILTSAGWTGNTFRPEATFEVGSGGFLVGEHLEQLKGADSRTAHGERLSGGLRTARGY
jgi:hypothetical protein